ncbi:unnamed protein product [Rotaria sordida]|uniref:Uncharacterized protein n=1 Tax=Rotaria sordida TaxID=392033 RepID=A0A814MW77_9BILA|nr:unnamed protein product [Rotaria sordida]
MIQMMESGDKYSMSKIHVTRISTSLTQMNSHEDNLSPNILLTKLNIPLNCLDNYQIRQHYLEEYSAKYSKAKHLLNNARKKQRKIIMTYYEAKGKENNIDELQTIKESLLEENEKIKKFKEALKDKLIIYQQRIQFLKDTEFWSTFEIQQLQSNTTESIENCTENSPKLSTTKDSLHLLHDLEQIKYSVNLLDDLCPTNTNEYYSELKLHEDNFSPIINNESNIISHLTDDYNLNEITLKHSQQLHTKLISKIDENLDSSISKKRTRHYFQWLKNNCQFIFMLTSNDQFDRFKIASMILMLSLVIFIVIFLNNLLEFFLIYLTKPSISITTLSSTNPIPISSFTYLLSNVYNWTISWLLPIFRIFKYSV